MIQHMPQLSKWQRYKPNVEARINGLMDGFYYQLGWAQGLIKVAQLFIV